MKFKSLLVFLFLRFSSCWIIRTPMTSLGGLELGTLTLGTGLIMDQTISKCSTQQLKTQSPQLYLKGLQSSAINLMLVGPSYYWCIQNWLPFDNLGHLSILDSSLLVFVHSIGYYSTHRLMHRSDLFRKYHQFHHQFNQTLIPTIGNSVSISEFTVAYMSPFILGYMLIHPNQESFNMGILIVSIMNLIIHTPELSKVSWSPWFVSPETHLKHHQGKNNRSVYSAPTLNLEFIIQQIYKKINDSDQDY